MDSFSLEASTRQKLRVLKSSAFLFCISSCFSSMVWAADDTKQPAAAEADYSVIPSLNHGTIQAVDVPANTAFPEVSKRWLGVWVNDREEEFVAEFIKEEDGRLLISPHELQAVGLVPAKTAYVKNGFIDISRLPHVIFDYNEEKQSIHFRTLVDTALIPVEISLSPLRRLSRSKGYAINETADDKPPVAKSNFGALVNYTLYADTGSEKFSDLWQFSGLSGQFDARMFSRLGTISSNQVARFSSGDYRDIVRLDTYWSYWDPKRLTSYTAGDFITNSLPWTRAVRMGGFQLRRNFAIRSDLVTMPLPSVAGSAAVPSSVDVYINNLRRNSAQLPAGPWRISDFPVVTGANEARLVVKDALGRETVTEIPFYANSNMLAKGLVDFSFEGGFLRYDFATRSNEYGRNFAVSGTLRYGFRDFLTLETHGEYTSGFYNGGLGAVFNVGSFGAVSVAGAASHLNGKHGSQASASFVMERWNVRFNAYSQRAFGEYNDLASATERKGRRWSDNENGDFYRSHYDNRPVKALHRISVGMPLRFDPTTLNLSYTRSEYHNNANNTELLSFSASRSFGRRIFGYASTYKDFKHKSSYGIFAGMSIRLDKGIQLSTGVTQDRKGASFQTEISKSATQAIGSTGWRLRDVEGARSSRLAYGTYRSRIARIEGSIEQSNGSYRLTAGVEGSIVAAGGGVFAANRIDDSFAVVDVGVPGVSVLRENSFYGRTGASGKLVIPGLQSYQRTKLSIKAQDMPFDAVALSTQMEIMPAYRTGVVANFAVEHMDSSLLIAVFDKDGEPLELGSLIKSGSGKEQITIGYSGQTLLPLDDIKLPASFIVQRANGGLCRITVPRSTSLGITNGVTEIQCTPL